MREEIKLFVEIAKETLKVLEPIYEFGSIQVPGQEGFADLRPVFAGKEYLGCDLREGPGVDRVLDLHDTGLASGSVGCVLIFDALEHMKFPFRAINEAHRILNPDGMIVMSSVMNWPIHCFPNDYWRFTPQAFELLLEPFETRFVESAGDEEFPHTVVGIGIKNQGVCLEKFLPLAEKWKQRQSPWRLAKAIKLCLPPVIPLLYRKIVGR